MADSEPSPIGPTARLEDLARGTATTAERAGELPSVAAVPLGAAVLAAGERVDGKFVVESGPVGARSGFGDVYRAVDDVLRRPVALKLLRRTGDTDAFLREARATARLDHEHIVRVHAAGVWHDQPYLALEWLEGAQPLPALEGGAPAEDVLRLGIALAHALSHAHARGVVHRDLKPDNVLLDARGRLAVIDFGLAMFMPDAPDLASVSRLSPAEWRRVAAGTLPYMAPEQLIGATQDERVDVWAAGVVLFEIATGVLPFPRPQQVLDPDAEPDWDLVSDARLRGILKRTMVRRADLRPSAWDLAEMLEEAAHPEREHPLPEALLAQAPWRGLDPYLEEHAPLYFGREPETQHAVARLLDDGALVVCGASGSGKSSLARAGVVPAVRRALGADGREAIAIVLSHPGAAPVQALASAVAALSASVRPPGFAEVVADELGPEGSAAGLTHLLRLLSAGGARPILLVDQLEEVATECEDPGQRARFFDVLCHAAERARDVPAIIVCTVRADALGGLMAHDGMRRLVQERLMALGPIGADRVRRIVERPLRGRGVRAAGELIDALADEVGRSPESLPLLSLVLGTLWERRAQATTELGAADYRALGGLETALSARADEAATSVAAKLTPSIDRLLLQLVHLTPDQAPMRRRITVSSLSGALAMEEEDVRSLVRPFVDQRLFAADREEASGEPVVCVAHEAIFRWPRYRELIEQHAEIVRLRDEVLAATERGELWTERADRLALADRLLAEGKLDLGQRERAFLDKSRARLRRRRMIAIGASVVIAVLAVVASVFGLRAGTERDRAEASATRAHASAVRAEASARAERSAATRARIQLLAAMGSAADARGRPAEALALLRAAAAPEHGADGARAAELGGILRLASDPAARAIVIPHASAVVSIAFSPDGALLATGSRSHATHMWDARTAAEVRVLGSEGVRVNAVTFSPDGALLATGSYNGAELWNTRTGSRVRALRVAALPTRETEADAALAPLPLHMRSLPEDGSVGALAFSPEGTLLATLSPRRAQLWDVRSGAPLRVLAGQPGRNDIDSWIGFSRDGTRIAACAGGGWGRGRGSVWNARSGALVRELDEGLATPLEDGLLNVCAFSPDDRWMALARSRVRLWLLHNQEDAGIPRRELRGHEADVWSIAFSPNGELLISGSDDRTGRVWQTRGAQATAVLRGHQGAVRAVAFAPDGARVGTGSVDRTARVWQLGEDVEVWPADVDSASSASDSDAARISGPRVIQLEATDTPGLAAVAFSPDGTIVAGVAGTIQATARLWNARTGAELRVLRGRDVTSLAFSPTGQLLATSSRDCTVCLLDPRTGRRLRALGGAQQQSAVAFSPDGRLVAARAFDGTVQLWDATTGADVRVLRGQRGEYHGSIAFSPDGARIATADGDRGARLLDVSTGAELHVLRGHDGPVRSVAFSSDGSLLATGSADGSVRFWDAATGASLRVFEGITEGGRSTQISLAFSPDGTVLVTGSGDFMSSPVTNTVRLWDVSTGTDLGPLPGDHGNVATIAFSPDGTVLAVGGEDTRPHLWRVPRAADIVRQTAASTNLRTCRESLRVVPVVLAPNTDHVWAPDSACSEDASVPRSDHSRASDRVPGRTSEARQESSQLRPQAEPSGPAELDPAAGECGGDAVAGVWRGTEYNRNRARTHEWTLEIARDGGNRLVGRIVNLTWSGAQGSPVPPPCAAGQLAYEISMDARGSIGPTLAIDFQGVGTWRHGPPICGQITRYDLDHFRGSLGAAGELTLFNEDGGAARGDRSVVFRRIRCN